MTNLIQSFLASRAKAAKQPVTNAAQPVTREEFNTVLRAVNALIEDFDAITSPDKIRAVFNAAINEAGVTTNARRAPGGFKLPAQDENFDLAPAGDDGAPLRNAAAPAPRPPLAPMPGYAFLCPKGE
jgi:hypothetical protein